MSHEHGSMITRQDAAEQVRSLRETVLSSHGRTQLDADSSITGRTVAKNITAPVDIPAHDRATMDGYAFDATEEYPYSVADVSSFPEDEPPSIDAGEAIRIATGAPLPERANAVLKIEEAVVEDGALTGPSIDPGTYTYQRGSNVTEGETLFEAGERLSAKDEILLQDLGIDTVSVYERFSVGLLATGSEIHDGTSTDLDSPMLAELVRSWGDHSVSAPETVPDEYERTKESIERLAGSHDVLITTGGTSVGKKDYVVRALEDLGDVHFHRVRVRPGKPIAVASLPDHDAVVFAIPGKPIGAHTVATLVMRPFFVGETGPYPTVEATLTEDVGLGPSGFEYMIPVVLTEQEATPLGHVNSPLEVYEETFDPSVLSSSTRASRADGIVITRTALNAGETVQIVPYSALE